MTAIGLAVFSLLVVYLVFKAVARDISEGKDEEVEVGLFPPKIRRRTSESTRRPVDRGGVPLESRSKDLGE
jgi:hypothetical protein